MVDLDLGQRLLQVLDPIVGDLGSLQVQRLQLSQLLDVLQPLVGDLGIGQAERLQPRAEGN
jgi:hypothetical protein